MKCKYWTEKIDYHGCIKFSKVNCKNKDSDCNIIKSKPSRMARIKAWAHDHKNGDITVQNKRQS